MYLYKYIILFSHNEIKQFLFKHVIKICHRLQFVMLDPSQMLAVFGSPWVVNSKIRTFWRIKIILILFEEFSLISNRILKSIGLFIFLSQSNLLRNQK